MLGAPMSSGPAWLAMAEFGLPGWMHSEQKPVSLTLCFDTCALYAALLTASSNASSRQASFRLPAMVANAFKSRNAVSFVGPVSSDTRLC